MSGLAMLVDVTFDPQAWCFWGACQPTPGVDVKVHAGPCSVTLLQLLHCPEA